VRLPGESNLDRDGHEPDDEARDESLMTRYRGGDVRAFERLLSRHKKPVFNFLLRHVGNRAVAEELLQEVFLRVIRSASSYQEQARFTTWLYTIARNLCVDTARRAEHRRAASLDAPTTGAEGEADRTLMEVVADPAGDPSREAQARELRVRIEQAIAALPDEQREVFLLRERAGLPFREIASIVGVPENTVKSRMRYALTRLREALAEYRDAAEAAR
jgi:RNA polymerase sigma-70 factor, ECF subfamily